MTRTITCVSFCDRVLRLHLTNGQRAFVAVTVDRVLPRDLDGAARTAALEMFGDLEEVPPGAYRMVVACLGRDSGKTEVASAIALYKLMTVDLSDRGPGDIPTAAIVAPRTRTARIMLGRARARVEQSPELARLLVDSGTKAEFYLRRPTDGRVVSFGVYAAARAGGSIRGLSLVVLAVDETADLRGSEAAVSIDDIVASAQARVVDGGLTMLLSTPFSEEGLFWKYISENHGKPSEALVARASTPIMRDYDPKVMARVEAERQRDPDNCQREYFAEFLSSGSSMFFDGESISDAVNDDRALAPVQSTERVGCGADVGLVKDSSAIAAVATNGHVMRLVEHLELRPARKQPLKLSDVIRQFAEVCHRHRVSTFIADGFAREPAREFAVEHKIGIEAAPAGPVGKYETYVGLRQALLERRVLLPNDPRVLTQLRAVQRKPLVGGSYQISTPRRIGNAHGDVVSALVLATHAVNGGLVDYAAAMRGLEYF